LEQTTILSRHARTHHPRTPNILIKSCAAGRRAARPQRILEPQLHRGPCAHASALSMIGKGQPNGARSALKPPECSARGQPAAASARGLPIGKGWGGSLTPSPSFELGRDAGVRPHCARRPSDRGLRRERLATAKPARVAQAPAAAKRAAAPKSKGATAMAACARAPWTACFTAETCW